MSGACSMFGKRDKRIENVRRIVWKKEVTSNSLKYALKYRKFKSIHVQVYYRPREFQQFETPRF
jgi:hypothetical protein